MDYPGFWKYKAFSDFLELRPTDATFVAAATQPISPSLLNELEHYLKCLVVAANSKIQVIASQLRTQPLVLLLDRLMAILAALLPLSL